MSRSLMSESEQIFPFFMPDGKSGRKCNIYLFPFCWCKWSRGQLPEKDSNSDNEIALIRVVLKDMKMEDTSPHISPCLNPKSRHANIPYRILTCWYLTQPEQRCLAFLLPPWRFGPTGSSICTIICRSRLLLWSLPLSRQILAFLGLLSFSGK